MGIAVHDLSLEQREHAVEPIELGGVEVAVPYRDVCVFADLDRADRVLQKKLVCVRDGVGAECRADVDGFFLSERMASMYAQKGFALDRCPKAVARRKRRDVEIGTRRPTECLGLDRS